MPAFHGTGTLQVPTACGIGHESRSAFVAICRTRCLQRVVAIFCMAMVCLFAVQTVIVGVDRVEHALEIEHHATDVAGTVVACDEDNAKCGSTGDTNISHSHFGDTASNFLPSAPDAQFAAPLVGDAVRSAPGFAIAGTDNARLERPPKA